MIAHRNATASTGPLQHSAQTHQRRYSLQAVERLGVLEEELLAGLVVNHAIELPLDDPLGIRPGASGVRVVRRPHDPIFEEHRQHLHAKRIVLERHPDVLRGNTRSAFARMRH